MDFGAMHKPYQRHHRDLSPYN